ncbi:MAG: hypothetical protein IPJ94_19665 [Chloroflexi bacterium]|nr:hypothetical protein [Chloroflexota bacterium]
MSATMARRITNRLDTLTGVGVTPADALALKTFADELDVLNAEQEELKAKLKTKTDELNAKLLKPRREIQALKQTHQKLPRRRNIGSLLALPPSGNLPRRCRLVNLEIGPIC